MYAKTCKCTPQPPPVSEIQKLLDQCMRLLPDHSSPPVVEAEERVECILCGSFHKNKVGLKSHKSRYHSEPEGTDGYSCDLCPRSFKSKSSLAIHMTKKHKKIDNGQQIYQIYNTFYSESMCFTVFQNINPGIADKTSGWQCSG